MNDSRNNQQEHYLLSSADHCGSVELPESSFPSASSCSNEHNNNRSNSRRTHFQPLPEPIVVTKDCLLPLSSNDDDDNNPNMTVYQEVKDMLLSAILMYAVVDLRALARKQMEITTTTEDSPSYYYLMLAEQLLALPITSKDVVRLVSKYRDDIVQEIGRESTVDLYLNAFDAIQSSSSSRELELEYNPATCQVSLVSFDVVVVEDENADCELVYAIFVDTSKRRITVTFRGCRNRTDWLVCAQTMLKEMENPALKENGSTDQSQQQRVAFQTSSTSNNNLNSTARQQRQQQQQPSTISLHSGYYNYLFSPCSKKQNSSQEEGASDSTQQPQPDGESKFDSIVRNLQSLLRQYPGYQIYVTGHSLGAALATVFSFHAAATNRLAESSSSSDPEDASSSSSSSSSSSPTITCINFASPMVGNFEFETAFRELEKQGRIRCLRVTNYFDIFTQLPDQGNWLYFLACVPWLGVHLLAYFGFSFLFFLCFQTHVYRHVGMNLHMYRGHRSWICCWPFRPRRQSDESQNGHGVDSNIKYWYKIKHSRGTSDNFAWRVVQDYKKHVKQLVQRILALPFILDFDTNHRAHEHLRRLTGLEQELEAITLKELYERNTPPTSPDSNVATNDCCFV